MTKEEALKGPCRIVWRDPVSFKNFPEEGISFAGTKFDLPSEHEFKRGVPAAIVEVVIRSSKFVVIPLKTKVTETQNRKE